NGFRDGMVDDFQVFARELTSLEVRHLYDGTALKEALAEGSDELFEYYLANFNPIYQKHLQDLRETRLQQSRLINPVPEVMVMQELAQPRPAFILQRGAYDAPGELVKMDTP